jgi:hypothetical protein
MRAPASTQQLKLLGQLMFQSHVSYSACDLGSSGTDRLVALVEKVRATQRHPLQLHEIRKQENYGAGSPAHVVLRFSTWRTVHSHPLDRLSARGAPRVVRRDPRASCTAPRSRAAAVAARCACWASGARRRTRRFGSC